MNEDMETQQERRPYKKEFPELKNIIEMKNALVWLESTLEMT